MSTTTRTFTVDGMHCGSCPLLIDETLEDLPGVASSTTELKRGTSTVEFDTTRTTVNDVIAAIKDAGYHATLQR